MKQLPVKGVSNMDPSKVLSNWSVASGFIYSEDISVDTVKVLLRHEVLNKNRKIIIERLKARLLNLMKQANSMEIEEDIDELFKEQAREDKGV